MRQPQLFIRVSRDRYVPIYSPIKGVDLYAWDDSKQRIIPYNRESSPKPLRGTEIIDSSEAYKVTPTR